MLSVPIVDLSGTYDSTTRRLGSLNCNFVFPNDPGDRWCFSAFGSQIVPGKTSPSYDYKVAAGASVFAATAGTVLRIEAETNPLYPGEFEIETRVGMAGTYAVIYDHVRNLTVALGSPVAAGDVLGVAGIHTSNPSVYGRVELQINKITQFSPTIQSVSMCARPLGTGRFNQLNDAARLAHNSANPSYAHASVCVSDGGCVYTLSSGSTTVPSGATTGSIALTTGTGCAWTATSDSTFLGVTSASGGTGSGTIAYSVAASAGTARAGSLTIGGQTLTVNQVAPGTVLPTMSLNRAALRFGAIKVGTALSASTAGQTVTIAQSGVGQVSWTAAADQGWVTLTSASGTGAGSFGVSVNNTGNVLPASGAVTANVTVALNGASTSSLTLPLTLVVSASGTSAAPIGAWDTPLSGATGLTGSIAITGWTLDDVEVARVRIYRAPVATEAAGTPIYLGDAVLVDGARPDVESAYATYPRASRAGWGYLLLTNMLPGQGNGPVVLSVYADDKDGKTTLLGTRTVTCANATATKPFGAIDTPDQGATVSGSAFVNFGWVLTPLPKSIPANGSTIVVYIDGVPIGVVTYDNYRADIAGLFPGLANTNGAIGFRTIDTTLLSNGLHTISWGVTDTANVSEGIGSRYFTVQNSALAVVPLTRPAPRQAQSDDVAVRRGYDPGAPLVAVRPDDRGARSIAARPLERVEIHAGRSIDRVYLSVNGESREPPIGSALDRGRGVFSWQPGPGFVGDYDLVFVGAQGESLRVQISLRR